MEILPSAICQRSGQEMQGPNSVLVLARVGRQHRRHPPLPLHIFVRILYKEFVAIFKQL